MGFFKGIAKTLLFLINFAILICAIALISLGVIYKVNNAGLDLMSVSSFTIAVGVIIALISFFGCYGACSSNGCLLTTYAIILFVLLIIQLVLGILAFVAIKNSDGQLTTEVQKYLVQLYNDYFTQPDRADLVDSLQKTFDCCGITGPTGAEVKYPNGTIIQSCCPSNVSPCVTGSTYTVGCKAKLVEFFEDHAKIIGGIALGFCAFELVAAIFALCVRKKRDGRYV